MSDIEKKAAKSAWIVAIGDELISGQRLDTNSQWIGQRLEQLGITVTRHCIVGDSLDDGVAIFSQAAQSADIVVCTGGIGPTKDDLTRQVLADVAGVELQFDAATEQHIKGIFESYGREMPENNRVQAFFPSGSKIIDNAEGTAPGIDLVVGNCRMFALPGVPYEMKQMWEDHVDTAIVAMQGQQKVIQHHAIHCFGSGESQIELMLDGMTDRGHNPRVGITASHATISLRITATGDSEAECASSIAETSEEIESKLGDLVFGHNGIELENVVIDTLRERKQTLTLFDYAFGGTVAVLLHEADPNRSAFLGATVARPRTKISREKLHEFAKRNRNESSADYAVVISQLYKVENERMFDLVIVGPIDFRTITLKYAGHSGLRQARTAKQILNAVRLYLQQ